MRVGKDALERALARPLAEPSALYKAVDSNVALERITGIGGWSIVARVEKLVEAHAHVRQKLVREITTRHAERSDARDPQDVQACEEEQAAPHHAHKHRLPEIGLQHERNDGRGKQQKRESGAWHIAPAGAFRKRPCCKDDEARLHEFRGLQAENPPARALNLDPELNRGEHA